MISIKNRLILICLKLLHFSLKRFSRQDPTAPRILIVSTTGFGDTLWATPALRAIKKTYPKSYVGVLTSSIGAQVLKHNPHIDAVWKLPQKGLIPFLQLVKKLRSHQFDTAILFHTSQRIAQVIASSSLAETVCGYLGFQKGLDVLLTHPVHSHPMHEIEKRLYLLKHLGISDEDLTLEFFITDEEQKISLHKYKELLGNSTDSTWVVFHPGAKDAYKRWSTDSFIKLGQKLLEHPHIKIILTGSHDEKHLTDAIHRYLPGSMNLSGLLSIQEMGSLLSQTKLMITNDTGPMHLSFAMKTPTLALFCATDAAFCGPIQVKDAFVIQKHKTCMPCLRKKCHLPFCLLQISPDEVYTKAKTILNLSSLNPARGL